MAAWIAAVLGLFVVRQASAATWGYTITSPTSVHFEVDDASWADLHYRVNDDVQLNVRMVPNGSNHTYDVTNIPSNATVRFFLTIGDFNGGALDTAWSEFSMSGGGGGTGEWAIVWEDHFNGSGRPDAASWNYHVGNGLNPGLGAFQGWGNGEWEWYRPENAYRQNGNLVIRADYNTSPTVIAGRDWYQYSSRITTKGKRSWTYGRIEARIAMPNAIGTWPAFWMMGTACDDTVTTDDHPPMTHYDVMASNWSSCGEIDIMEHRNFESVTFQNLFWDSRIGVFPWGDGLNNDRASSSQAGDVSQFHLYTIEWEPTQIRWYIDRESRPTPVHMVDITSSNMEEFHKPFHIIFNLALSGQFTGYAEPNLADFPLFMYVDYVRVWQRQ